MVRKKLKSKSKQTLDELKACFHDFLWANWGNEGAGLLFDTEMNCGSRRKVLRRLLKCNDVIPEEECADRFPRGSTYAEIARQLAELIDGDDVLRIDTCFCGHLEMSHDGSLCTANDLSAVVECKCTEYRQDPKVAAMYRRYASRPLLGPKPR